MNLIKIACWLTLPVVFSCNSPRSEKAQTSEKVRDAQLIDSIVIKDNVARISNITVTGNAALIVTNERENFIRAFSYPEFMNIDSTGTRGQGPGEWVSVMTGQSDVAGEIPVYDIMNRLVRIASVNDSSLTVDDCCMLPVDDEGDALPYGNLIKLPDGHWLAKENDIRRSKLSIIDLTTGDEKATFIPQLEINDRIKGYPSDDYWIAESDGRVVVGYVQFERIDVLNLTDLSTIASIGEKSIFNKDKIYTIKAVAHDGRFYLLQSPEESGEGQIIRVVDCNGNEENPIRLTRPAYAIAFDADGMLLAIEETPEANICFRYAL